MSWTASDPGPGPSREPQGSPGDARTTTSEPREGEGERRDRDSLGAFLRELPVLIVIAFLLAFLLRTFVVQVFYIPSSSMVPTLEVNDRILVDKVTYRFRDLRRGEVVVFEGDSLGVPEVDRGPVERAVRGIGQLVGLAPANARDFVKRVIGLPGDEVEIDDEGTVFVNGVALDEPYVAAEDPRPFGPVEVPEGKLFFLGDNRPNSSDSRVSEGLGFVDRDHVVGRAFVIIWPLGRLDVLHRPDYPPIPDDPVEGDAAPAPAAPAGSAAATVELARAS